MTRSKKSPDLPVSGALDQKPELSSISEYGPHQVFDGMRQVNTALQLQSSTDAPAA